MQIHLQASFWQGENVEEIFVDIHLYNYNPGSGLDFEDSNTNWSHDYHAF